MYSYILVPYVPLWSSCVSHFVSLGAAVASGDLNYCFCLSCPKFQPKDSILAWEFPIKPNSLGKSWRAPWRPVAGNQQFLLSCPNFLAKDSIFDWEVPIKPNKTQFSETVLEDSMPSRSWKPSFLLELSQLFGKRLNFCLRGPNKTQ